MTASERESPGPFPWPGAGAPVNQYTQINNIGTAGPHNRRRPFGLLHESDLGWLYRRFEPPEGFPHAQHKLEKCGLVLISGPAGAGTRTAAKMLLRTYADSSHLFRVLPTEVEEDAFDPESVADGDLLLLDLSAVESEHYAKLKEKALYLRAHTKARSTRLVIIVDRAVEEQFEFDESRQFLVPLGRPDPAVVLRRHLAADGLSGDLDPAEYQAFCASLVSSSMNDLARLADRARLLARGGERLLDLLREAQQAVADRTEEARKLLDGKKDGVVRALALAVAMLEGEHRRVVFAAAAKLLTQVEHPESEVPLLERPSLSGYLGEVTAVAVDEHGGIRFREAGYGAAVAAYFWREYPRLHNVLRDWSAGLVGMEELSRRSRLRLADRVAIQLLDADLHDDLAKLVRNWPRARDWPDQVQTVLSRSLAHPRHGRFFRQQFYTWARARDLPDQFAAVLADLCAAEMAAEYPEEALTRLNHLVKRNRDSIDSYALERLLELVASDLRLYRRLAWRLRQHPPRPGRGRSETELALRVLSPKLVLSTDVRGRRFGADPTVRRCVEAVWRALMTSLPEREWQEHLRAWLTECVDAEAPDAAMLVREVLAGAGGAPRTLAAVYVAARDWARSGDRVSRARLALLVIQLINEAQGVVDPDATLREKKGRS